MTLKEELDKLEEAEIVLQYYETYFAIATRNFTIVEQFVNERSSIEDKTKNFILVSRINAKIEQHSIISVVFCVMTLESFINNYMVENISKSYFQKYLDKLDLKSKWVIFPRLVNGKEFSTDSQAFEDFGNLISLRNRIIHDKPRKKKLFELDEKDMVYENDAKNAINAVREMIGQLSKIDSNIETDWLDEVEMNPYK